MFMPSEKHRKTNIIFYLIIIAFLLVALFFGFFLVLGLFRFVSLKMGIGLVEGDMIDNETLLALLSLLVIFGGLLAYIFQRIIRNELKEEIRQETRELLKELSEKIKKQAEAERLVSLSENYVAQSNILAKLYDPSVAERRNFLSEAWEFDRRAFGAAKLLESKGYQKNYGRLIFRAKNNYLCGLIEQQKQRKKNGLAIDPVVTEKMLRIKDELWQLIVSGEAEKYDPDVYHFKETCAWAIYFLAESDEEKEKACAIIRGLEGNSPTEWYQGIKIKYGID